MHCCKKPIHTSCLLEWIIRTPMCRCPHCRHSPPHCRYLFDICRLYFEKYHKHIYCKEATDIYLGPLLNRCGYVLWRSLNDELVKNSDSMFGFDVNMDYQGLVRSLVCWFCKKAIIPEENHDNYHTFLCNSYVCQPKPQHEDFRHTTEYPLSCPIGCVKHPLAITNAWDFLRCYLRYTTNKEAKKEIQLICMQYFLRVVFQDILNFSSLKNSIEQQEYLQQTRYRRVPFILRRLGFDHKRYDARFQFKFFCIHNFMRGTAVRLPRLFLFFLNVLLVVDLFPRGGMGNVKDT